jgi:Ca2+-binding EF-hand superfamily protein
MYAFRLFDSKKTGYICEQDLSEMFSKLNWNDKTNTKEILKTMDYNGDGKVCFKGIVYNPIQLNFNQLKLTPLKILQV